MVSFKHSKVGNTVYVKNMNFFKNPATGLGLVFPSGSRPFPEVDLRLPPVVLLCVVLRQRRLRLEVLAALRDVLLQGLREAQLVDLLLALKSEKNGTITWLRGETDSLQYSGIFLQCKCVLVI